MPAAGAVQDAVAARHKEAQKAMVEEAVKSSAGQSFIKIMLYALFAFLGLMLGLLGGYLAGKGLKTFAGGLIGLLCGLVIALFVSGAFGEFMDKTGDDMLDASSPLVPSVFQEQAFGHKPFSVLVTVHEVRSMGGGGMRMATYDAYVVIKCGGNPEKSTCVRSDAVFNETVKLKVGLTDRYINFILKDQDMISDDVVGGLALDVNDVINTGFPVMKAYSLTKIIGGVPKKIGNLMLSFDWCDDFPKDRLQHLIETKPVEFQRRQKVREQLLAQEGERKEKVPSYATFATNVTSTDNLFSKTINQQ